MRHIIGRADAGLMTDGTAGVSKPRPCRRIAWGVVVSVLAHVSVFALAWQTTPTRKPSKEATRLSVRLVAQAPRSAVEVPKAALPSASKTKGSAPVLAEATATRRASTKAAPRKVAPAPAPARPSAAQAPAAPAETIDGSVFALPHIGGLGGNAAPRWMKTQGLPAMPPPSFAPPPAMHMHAVREAARIQLMLALQQQVSDWPVPDDAADGVCSLQAQADVQLACDNAPLQQVVGAQAAGLSGLLEAYRGLDPSVSLLSIAYQQGRYRVSLMRAAPPQ